MHPREAFPRWRAAALKALELDPTLPEAHAQLAATRFYADWDWAGAEDALRSAIELNPGHPELRVWYAELLSSTGRQEAGIAEVRRALELDPHNSTFRAWVGQHLLQARRYDEAIEHLEDLLRSDPNEPLARGQLWSAYERKGMYDDALAHAKRLVAARGDAEVAEALDRGHARGGYRGAMRSWAEILARRAASTYVPATRVAHLYAAARETDLALDWLERGYQDGESQIVYLGVAPHWEALRDDPRFRDLLVRIGLR